ncbi:DUF4169 family protein [Sphingomonas sp. BK580]|uniref:DUF4169 family protein n=1 Tax=Sphingomonas sp. BK580 TaxID=2586972 RepID=UPI00160AA1B3|nr:DUF4169 family protein [Sphingomonas sp. BK580]MBB3694703.1 phage protein D [Sphingomonas sp. BK580]
MGELVSLNRARKARKRAEDATQAAANRVAHGRTKAEKQAERQERARQEAVLDGAALERGRDDAKATSEV